MMLRWVLLRRQSRSTQPVLTSLFFPNRRFHSQHRTPVLPQVHVHDGPTTQRVHVGVLLHRNQVVKHTPHPLEIELSYILEREQQRYSRHETAETATAFFASRGHTLDIQNRSDVNQVKGDFFGLELYQDAVKVVLQRYTPEKRVTAKDLWRPDALADAPPPRHSLHRKLDDFLYLIVQEEATGAWTIPQSARSDTESLRMTVDRTISQQNRDGLDCYVWSNAPQGTVLVRDENTRLFIYAATYLAGRPRFELYEPKLKDHAWVTRKELLQYRESFKSPELLEVLRDISADSSFEA